VRDLKGLTREEACARLQQDGLNCVEGEPRFDPYVIPGQVVAQEPTYGVLVDRGTAVTLHLGASPGLSRVPSVLLMSFAGAKLVLGQAGFRVEQAEVGCVSTPQGYVDRQDPPAGRQDIQGITVTVYVSTGDQTVLPEILRVPLEQARQRITEASLALRWEQPQTQANMPPGVDIDSLGAPGQVISYIVSFNGHGYNSGVLLPGDQVPCGATIDVAYYATSP
jgi:serine/threonine-protein kinase